MGFPYGKEPTGNPPDLFKKGTSYQGTFDGMYVELQNRKVSATVLERIGHNGGKRNNCW